MADQRTLELVVYRLTEGATREGFLATHRAASEWMQRQSGFISHELSYAADGERWVELVWWQSREHAEAAARAAMSSDSCAPMFALIDMESALMLHAEPAIPPSTAERGEVEA